MKRISLILFFVSCALISFSQSVTTRTNGTTTPLDVRLMTQKNLYIPRVACGGDLQGGVDTLGAIVYSRCDSAIYYYNKNGNWGKLLTSVTLGAYMLKSDSTLYITPTDLSDSMFVVQNRTLTINGVSQNLYANRTWNVGTLVGADTNYIHAKLVTAFNSASFDTTTRILKFKTIGGDSLSVVIPRGSSGGGSGGPTSFSFNVTGNTVTELWDTGPTASFDKSDSRISTQMVTNINTIPNGGETLQSTTTRGNVTTNGISLNGGNFNLFSAPINLQNDVNKTILITQPNGAINQLTIGLSNAPTGGTTTFGMQALDSSAYWNVVGKKYFLHQGNVRAGTGVTLDTSGRGLTINATGTIASIIAGAGIGVSGTNNITVSNTGVRSLTATAPIALSASTGTPVISHNTSGVTAGSGYTKFNVDQYGHVTFGGQLAQSDITTALGFTPLNPSLYPVNLNGETLQSVTDRNNITTNSMIIASTSGVTSANFTGLQMYWDGTNNKSIVRSINRALFLSTPLQLTGGSGLTGATTNVLEVGADLKYSISTGAFKQVWYQDGANETGSMIRSTGVANAFATGAGAEIYFQSGSAFFRGVNESTASFTPTNIQGGNNTTTANTLKISNDITYNNNPIWYSTSVTGGTGISISAKTITNTGVTSLNGSTGAVTIPTLSSGLYTPTITYSGVANVTAITLYQAAYTRVGNIVHCSVEIGFNASTIGTGTFFIGLPYASSTTTQAVAGSGTGSGSAGVSANPTMFVSASSSTATCNFGVGTTGTNLGVFLQFDYIAP